MDRLLEDNYLIHNTLNLSQIGNLYMSLGNAVAEYPNGVRDLSSAEKHAIALLKSNLNNMLSTVSEWSYQSRLSSADWNVGISTDRGDGIPNWYKNKGENLYERN